MELKTLTIPEIAEQLQISLPTAYTLAKREDFPVVTIDRRILVVRELFDEWLVKEATGKTNAGR